MGYDTIKKARQNERFAYYHDEGYLPLIHFSQNIFIMKTPQAQQEYERLINWAFHGLSMLKDNIDEPVFVLVNTAQAFIEQCKLIEGLEIHPRFHPLNKDDETN